MYTISLYQNITTTITSNVVSSAAVKLTPATPAAHRQGYVVCNNDATYNLYILETNSDSVPSFTSASGFVRILAPGSSFTASAGSAVRLWAINNTSPSASTVATLSELA